MEDEGVNEILIKGVFISESTNEYSSETKNQD
jgi:hypothetical protein